MLTTAQLAYVTPEVHAGKKACTCSIQPGFEIQGRYHQRPKREHKWPNKKDLCPLKNSDGPPNE